MEQPPIDLALNYLPSKPPKTDYGIGCIGAGFIMRECHLVAYANAGYNAVAISSRTRESAEAAARATGVQKVYDTYREVIEDPDVEIVDIAVPPDQQLNVVRQVCEFGRGKVQGILAQKPLASNYAEARELVQLCEDTNIPVSVNHNMRCDLSVRALKSALNKGYIGDPVLATIEMRAIPHFAPWQQAQGWMTLRLMSIHHLDTFRFWFGNPERIFCSVRKDPRTLEQYDHEDGICLYILEYENGLRCSSWDDVWSGPVREGTAADNYIKWRVEGMDGMAWGHIGWPDYPKRRPSTFHLTTKEHPNTWFHPQWDQVWFPDAFEETMGGLMAAIHDGTEPAISAKDNLNTMALVDAAYKSVDERRAVALTEILG